MRPADILFFLEGIHLTILMLFTTTAEVLMLDGDLLAEFVTLPEAWQRKLLQEAEKTEALEQEEELPADLPPSRDPKVVADVMRRALAGCY